MEYDLLGNGNGKNNERLCTELISASINGAGLAFIDIA